MDDRFPISNIFMEKVQVPTANVGSKLLIVSISVTCILILLLIL